MPTHKVKRALISVYDKTGVVDFARTLVEEFGVEVLSTGGTAKLLTEGGIPVTLVENITGWGEMLDGRVKTLHPKIHAAILADRDNPDHMKQLADAGIEPIDMVVVNLYPFEKTVADPDCKFEDAIEMIDIGGPCMLRAAAKNHRSVLVIPHPIWYSQALDALRGEHAFSLGKLSREIANCVFALSRKYDSRIWEYLMTGAGGRGCLLHDLELERFESSLMLAMFRDAILKYGENPHQESAIYSGATACRSSVSEDRVSGPMPSFNNLVDADAALALCRELVCAEHIAKSHAEAHGIQTNYARTCVFVKHTNVCGVGVADDAVESYRRAYLGDPNAAMGGVLACSSEVTEEFADVVMNSLANWGEDAGAGAFFLEVWLAPAFEGKAIQAICSAKKWGERVRLISVGQMDVAPDPNALEIKAVAGAILMQTPDTVGLNEDQWEIVTKREPTAREMDDLRLAWLVCKHTKSNAISICKDGMLIGNGAGQMSRVMSCRIATWLANENGHTDKLAGSAAASDAFFPFRDGPDILIDAGVTAIIQPGGSKRDADTIAACDERDIAMIFTGTRHFKH